ncbi:MAG TPA: hypothetical protein VFF52_09830 [Isosphaeraceae bacterium]|nr:hypothetical protein [Isosphaeraceae bacterium]
MSSFESLYGALTAVSSSMRLWGYLDPGTGSMLFQVLVAGLLSASFFLRSGARYIRDGVLLKLRRS